VAWYFLGLVRTLALLDPGDRPATLLAEVERMAQWVGKRQLSNGLWPSFLDEPAILPDTSGSSGIAAAIAIAVRQNMLPPCHQLSARKAHDRLIDDYLDQDGWLRGASGTTTDPIAEMR